MTETDDLKRFYSRRPGMEVLGNTRRGGAEEESWGLTLELEAGRGTGEKTARKGCVAKHSGRGWVRESPDNVGT